MTTEFELQLLARLRAHEVLIQNLLRLVFNNDAEATRDFAARQNACLDTSRLPDLDKVMSRRLPYETQEALTGILNEAVAHTTEQRHNQSSDESDN